MDVDALARDVAERTMRSDFASPPFPPYLPGWVERMRAEMPAEFAAAASEARLVETCDRVTHERAGDLEVYLYRVEPGACGLLLILRDEELAYVTFAGNWFLMPEDMYSRFPPFDLSMMAVGARADAELGVRLGGFGGPTDGPVGVEFQIDRARYESLDDAARTALHERCAPVARDAALLLCGRASPLVIRFAEPEEPQRFGGDADAGHATFHVDTRKPGAERLIAEFEVP